MSSCLSEYGTGAALAMSVTIDDRSAAASWSSGSETMRLSWVGAVKVLVTRCSADQPHPRGGVEAAHDHDRVRELHRHAGEGQRTRVVQRPGREVHAIGVEEVQLGEQRDRRAPGRWPCASPPSACRSCPTCRSSPRPVGRSLVTSGG